LTSGKSLRDGPPETVESHNGSLRVSARASNARLRSLESVNQDPEPETCMGWCILYAKTIWLIIASVLVSGTSWSAPTVSNVTLPSDVGLYQKFEATFDLATVATNPYWPYDESPNPGVTPGVGVSVEGLFSNDNWQTTLRKPGFYYQRYISESHPNTLNPAGEWIYPTGAPVWCVRFAPFAQGTWRFRIRVTDSSGTTTYPSSGDLTFNCSPSSKKGFVRVSTADPRYFEFSDGSPWVTGLGLKDNTGGDTMAMARDYAELSANGVKLLREGWTSYSALSLSGIANTNRIGGNGICAIYDAAQGYNGRKLGWWLGASASKREATVNVYCRPSTRYRISVMGKTLNIVGTGTFGPTLWGISYADWRRLTQPLPANSGWRNVTADVTTPADLYYLHVKLVNENLTSGDVYFSDFSIREILSGGGLGPELVDQPHPDVWTYTPQFTAWRCERQLELAEANDLFMKVTVQEKEDSIWARILADGSFGPSIDARNVYASSTSANRTLQTYYWRSLVARYGHCTAVHSFELFNEADPFDGNHHAAAQAFAKYMHDNNPNRQMCTTSCWHSYPSLEFWANPAFPDIDYADIHRYVDVPVAYYGLPPDMIARLETRPGYVHSGTRSVVLTAPADDVCRSWSRIPVSPGHTYQASYWVKAENLTWRGTGNAASPNLWIGEYTGWWNSPVGTQFIGPRTTTVGSFDWRQYTYTFTAGPNTWFFLCSVRLVNCTGGRAWFDDIVIEDTTTGKRVVLPNSDLETPDLIYADSALEHAAVVANTVSTRLDRRQVAKPIIRGETGLTAADGNEHADLDRDSGNVWLKKKVWSQIGPGGLIEMCWWREKLEPAKRWKIAKAYRDLMAAIPFNNGNYVDAEASSSGPTVRVVGQKDLTNNLAHLWIDNTGYTWKKVVDGTAVQPVSGTVTLDGLRSGSYRVDWWDTDNGGVTRSDQIESVGGVISLSVANLQSDTACRIYPAPASIEVRLVVPSDQVEPGEVVAVRLEYTNASDSTARNVVPVATVPQEMDYVTGSAEESGGVWDPVAKTVKWTIETLGPRESGFRTFRARVR